MKVQMMAIVMLTIVQLTAAASIYFGYPGESERTVPVKRAVPQQEPEWNQLGWAWGKRSGRDAVPRRLIRALHPVKKNPDWQDLGFAWGRK